MPIEGVNTAMTALQFAHARSFSRAVETANHPSSKSQQNTLPHLQKLSGSALRSVLRSPTHMLLPPASFHCTYRPLPGKSAAKRQPQVADSHYWSSCLNRLA
jgi:hypothetical protein